MPAKKKGAATAEPKVETRSFEEIVSERMPARKSTRDLLAEAVEARAESRKKIEAQEPRREQHRRFIERVTKGTRPGTTEYYQAVAEAQRRLAE
jgi:hypothetical protein